MIFFIMLDFSLFNIKIDSIFKAQEQSILSFKKGENLNENIIEIIKNNIKETFKEVQNEFDKLNFYRYAPIFEEDFIKQRDFIFSEARNEIKSETGKAQRISGAFGSYLFQIENAIKRKHEKRIKDLEDKYNKNNKKYEYILNLISEVYNKHRKDIENLSVNKNIPNEKIESLMFFLDSLKKSVSESIRIKLIWFINK